VVHKTKHIKKEELRRFHYKKALARYNLRPLATTTEDVHHIHDGHDGGHGNGEVTD
jgi:hypothetical protein